MNEMLPLNKQWSVHWKRKKNNKRKEEKKKKKEKQNAQPEAISGAD